MLLKPVTSEKAVKMVEIDNILLFETSMNDTKPEIKKEVESVFNVKVEKVRTHIKLNKKY